MKHSRFHQIKELQSTFGRSEIESLIPQMNMSIFEKNEKIISILDEYIKKYITSEDFSLDYIENLLGKLDFFGGIEIEKNLSIYQMLYTIIFNTVLLPDYLGDDEEENYREIKKIIDNILISFETKVDKGIEKKYNIELGNAGAIYQEIVENTELGLSLIEPRAFHIGNGFGFNMFFYDDEKGEFLMKIPVDKLSRENKFKRGISQKKITSLIRDIVQKYSEETSLIKYNISIDEVVDLEGSYGEEIDSEYWVINLQTASRLKNMQDILDDMRGILDMNNYIINSLSHELGIEVEKKVNIFSSGAMINLTFEKGYIEGEKEMYGNEPENLTRSDIQRKKLKLSGDKKVYLSDVGGQKEAKKEIETVIDMIKRENIFKDYGARLTKGVILEGPSGTGKTLLAKVIATEIDADIYNIKLTDIQSDAYINSGANNIKSLFQFLREESKKQSKKIIVILDELDALFKKRSGASGSQEDVKIVNTFLAELDGIDDLENVIFVGTTNSIDSIDDAVLRSGRMENKITIGLPNLEDLKEIYDIHIRKLPELGQELFSDIDRDELAQKTLGFTGANVEDMVNRLITKKVREGETSSDIQKITLEDITELLGKIKGEEKVKVFGFQG